MVLKVNAFAGTGKTTTLEGFALARPNIPILYLAFNKSVADSARKRFPAYVESITVHALAMRLGPYPDRVVVADKDPRLRSCVKVFLIERNPNSNIMAEDTSGTVKLVLNVLNRFLISGDDEVDRKTHALLPGLKEGLSPRWLAERAQAVWDAMNSGNLLITDQNGQRRPCMTFDGYVKGYQLSNPLIPDGRKIVLLDEAQDTNPVVFKLVESWLSAGACLVLCGDKHQSIYSWRGATNAMAFLPTAPILPLTESFRFGISIAERANHVLQLLGEDPNKISGVGPAGWANPSAVDQSQPYTFIARKNATLFEHALAAATLGRTVGGPLDSKLLSVLIDELETIFALSDYDFDSAKQVANAQGDIARLALLGLVTRREMTMRADLDMVAAAIPSSQAGPPHVTLVTAHRAKGLEWDNVVLADDFQSPFAGDGKLLKLCEEPIPLNPSGPITQIFREELNMLYVAVTRAKLNVSTNSVLDRISAYLNPSSAGAASSGGTGSGVAVATLLPRGSV